MLYFGVFLLGAGLGIYAVGIKAFGQGYEVGVWRTMDACQKAGISITEKQADELVSSIKNPVKW